MITMKEWMELVDYRITEGGDYGWQCYGPNAYSLSSWNGIHGAGGYSFDIVFSTKTQKVYEVSVCDYTNNRAYRMILADKQKKHRKEIASHNSGDQAWDSVEYIDLDVDDDFISKSLAIKAGKEYDTRVQVELDLDKDTQFQLMTLAHQRGITTDAFVEEILRGVIDNETTAMPAKWTVTLVENPDNPDEMIMPLPQDLLDTQGWTEGDTLDWSDNNDGTWTLTKL